MYCLNILYVLIAILSSCDGVNEDAVNNFIKYINDELKWLKNYKLPNSSFSYKPTSATVIDHGSFDFIIVGAGSSGTVLANRLSENPKWKILILEAGDYPNNFTVVPGLAPYLLNSDYNWGYKTTVQKYSCLGRQNHKCPIPSGRGVGGSSIISDLIYIRDHYTNYDRLEATENFGWSYNKVLQFFLLSENLVRNNPDAVVNWNYHGTKGPLHVQYNHKINPIQDAFAMANKKFQFSSVDPNSPSQIGYSPTPVNVKNGRRFDGNKAYIEPIRNRTNLMILTNCMATKVVVDPFMNADSVAFSCNGSLHQAKASKEIILSAGAIGTPRLLMLSGIGPEQHLSQLKIPVISNLEVGTALREKPTLPILYFSTNSTKQYQTLKEELRDYLHGVGSLTIPGGWRSLGFYRTKFQMQSDFPDLQILLKLRDCNVRGQCFTMTPTAVNPISVGNLRLKTKDPFDYPLINTNMLSDSYNSDINVLYEGIKFIFKLIQAGPFKKLNTTLMNKPRMPCSKFKYGTRKYWHCTIRQYTIPHNHISGTCPMGVNRTQGAVINHHFKVYGVDNLRIADASIFPFVMTGHPNAACVMIGEKLADLLKTVYV